MYWVVALGGAFLALVQALAVVTRLHFATHTRLHAISTRLRRSKPLWMQYHHAPRLIAKRRRLERRQ
jgi:hypothetical protein